MKPHLLKFNLKNESSFVIRHDVVPHFYNKWQYHPELELVYIIKGSGRQFIGDNVHHFKAGDEPTHPRPLIAPGGSISNQG